MIGAGWGGFGAEEALDAAVFVLTEEAREFTKDFVGVLIGGGDCVLENFHGEN